ncbi:insulinase family protein [Ilyomonas limi]|uniref:Insulinase family protein n=1 Tax=Ilyomonas limi TaxID=2575867 RepID=A0A4U3L995_9BACT|nr:pitrilysin family protein [Ilyomonas limi]TKK71652.1 insulinase family protein [Ilyomonas limi]
MQLIVCKTGKLMSLLALLFLSFTAFAQTTTVAFEVNGLKVILKQTQKETLVMSMYYKGGLTNYPAADAGIESLALSGIIDGGNHTFSANDFNDQRDEYGIHLTGEAANDYGVVKLRCITRYAEEGWKLFASAITAPIFDAKKFDILKQQKTDELNAGLSNADARLSQLATATAFAGTPYANNPAGTVENIARLTRDAVEDYYYNILLNRKRMFLVVAGNISKEDLEQKVKNAFSDIPEKAYTPVPVKEEPFTRDVYKIEGRSLATNYVCGIVNAPGLNSPDYPAYRLAVTILHSTLFREIRLSKRLSYAPAAYLSGGKISYLTMYASTTQPQETVKAMYNVLSHVRASIYTDKTVADLQNSVSLSYLKQQESMSNIVDALGEAEIMGDWRLAENFDVRVSAVTAKEIQSVFKAYTNNITWAYIGNPGLGEQAFTQ